MGCDYICRTLHLGMVVGLFRDRKHIVLSKVQFTPCCALVTHTFAGTGNIHTMSLFNSAMKIKALFNQHCVLVPANYLHLLVPCMKCCLKLFKVDLNIDKPIINSLSYTVETPNTLPEVLRPENIMTKTTEKSVFFCSANPHVYDHHQTSFTAENREYNCRAVYHV